MTDLRAATPAEFALRVVARPGAGDWLVLVAPADIQSGVAERICTEIKVLGPYSVTYVEAVPSPLELAETVQAVDANHVLVVSGVDQFSEDDWQHIDLLRSRLRREWASVLIVSQDSAERLSRAAPNFSSWIAGGLWQVDLETELVSDDEREVRLRSLREAFSKTDAEILALAEKRQLPNEPEFVEWLLLLNRADLIER